MAGIDINGIFPNSKMAGAAKLGQSFFRTIDTAVGSMAAQTDVEKEPEKKPMPRK